MQDNKLYVVVRADLSPGLAAAQAVHAAFAFYREHPEMTTHWLDVSQYLVLVDAADEIALIALASQALSQDVPMTTWHEPDRGLEATAVALGPCAASRRLTANLPLHGRTLAGTAV